MLDTMLTAPDFLEDHERNMLLSIAPGQGKRPLSVFRDKYSEELAFPNIFQGLPRIENNKRKVPVTYSEVCKSELKRQDRRAAQDTANMFYKTKKVQMKATLDKSQIALRKGRSGDAGVLNAGKLKDKSQLKSIIFKDIGFKFLNTVRGSPPYFQAVSKDLFAMIRQLGVGSLFCSFSSAETKWIHLLKILGKTVDRVDYSDEQINSMTWDEKCRLIRSDPVICAWHFHYQCQELIKLLHHPSSPLGKVKDYFYRVEFQHRGSPHIHMILWIEDAPKIDVNSDEEVCTFIDSLITCHKPSLETDPELANLVNYQMHRHSKTCRKGKKFQCRFNYPIFPMSRTRVLRPLDEENPAKLKDYKDGFDRIRALLKEMDMGEDISFEEFLGKLNMTESFYISCLSLSLKDTAVFLKRTPNEIRVNSYNHIILKAWRANMDVQFIVNAYACAMYVASYVTKSQRGLSELLRQACQEAREDCNGDIRKQLQCIGNKFLNSVEISAQEAAYILLQLPLRRSSRKCIFVNTSPPEDRVVLLKPQHVLDNLDDDDEDVHATTSVDAYQSRPSSLENISYAEFMSSYEKKKRPVSRARKTAEKTIDGFIPESGQSIDDDYEDEDSPVNVLPPGYGSSEDGTTVNAGLTNEYYQRKRPKIIRTCRFNKQTDKEKHYRELLMLYTHWRNEEELIGDCITFEDRYLQVKESVEEERVQFEPSAQEVDEAIEQAERADDLQSAYDRLNPGAEHLNANDLHNAERNADNEPGEQYNIGPDLGIEPRPAYTISSTALMDTDEYYRRMMTLNSEQYKFVIDLLHHVKTSDEPVVRFLSGGAGVGKTHTTHMLYETLARQFQRQAGEDPELACILKMAPTGKAAYLMKGNTCHCVLLIPVSQSLNYKSLTNDVLNSMRTKLRRLKFIIIDEVSMVGVRMLNFIHRRLQDIMGSSKDFGGVSVVFIGDLFQLPPVCDDFCFNNSKKGLLSLATNLWQKHVCMHELKIIMRQADDKEFAELLNRVREGLHTPSDIAVLQSRILPDNADTGHLKTVLHPFNTNRLVNEHNSAIFQSSENEKNYIQAVDDVVESMDAEVRRMLLSKIPTDPTKTMQLYKLLEVSVELRYEVSLNVDTDDGITNGASCVIKSIRLDRSNTAKGIIWVQFDDSDVGKKAREKQQALRTQLDMPDEYTAILPTSRKFSVWRGEQVVRMQFPLRPASAKTMNRAQGSTVLEIVVDFQGRCRAGIVYVAISRVPNLNALHMRNFRPENITVSKSVKKEMERLRSLPYPWTSTFLSEVDSPFKISFLNVCSLHAKKANVSSDHDISKVDIMFCAETRFLENDPKHIFTIDGFQCFRNDAKSTTGKRPYLGLAAYIKSQHRPRALEKATFWGVDIIQCEVDTPQGELIIYAFYKQQKVTCKDFILALKTVLEEFDPNEHQVILIGDANINLLSDDGDAEALKEFLASKQLDQKINQPTNNMRNCIDHIYTNVDSCVCGVSENYYSDHKGIWFALK